VTSEYYASPWLLTFFAVLGPQHHKTPSGQLESTTCFDLNFTLSVIDLFLLEGIVALVRICLGLLGALAPILITLDHEDLLVYLKTFTCPALEEGLGTISNGTGSRKRSVIQDITTDCEAFFARTLREYPVTRVQLEQIEKIVSESGREKGQESLLERIEYCKQTKRFEMVERRKESGETLKVEKTPKVSNSSS
jgi:hypothetical protein